MNSRDAPQRRFLFLQGPHGPFFSALAHLLRATGSEVWRVGFNAGDQAFWRDKAHYIAFTAPQENWPDTCTALLENHAITDLVLYGDTRPIHAQAIACAKQRGVRVHVFEEGYLRPYWITYERDGANGNSPLMAMDVARMRQALARRPSDLSEPPAHWGDMRQHIFYGALYHWFVLFRNRRYRTFRPHRSLPLWQETRAYTQRLVTMPFHALARSLKHRQIAGGNAPFHLVLLQLEHDANFLTHSPFSTMDEFIDTCISGFARGAPGHHHLVFKDHPLDPTPARQRRRVHKAAKAHGIARRVHFVTGGKLAQILAPARSAVTVNSTAAHQVLWRAIPLKAFGRAIYAKPEFTSSQDLHEFFAQPAPPDKEAYQAFRTYLLETSQISGGFYARANRKQVLRQIVDLLLAETGPYDRRDHTTEGPVDALPAQPHKLRALSGRAQDLDSAS